MIHGFSSIKRPLPLTQDELAELITHRTSFNATDLIKLAVTTIHDCDADGNPFYVHEVYWSTELDQVEKAA